MNINLHRIKSIKIEKIRELTGDDSFNRELRIETTDGLTIRLDLFADERSRLAIEVQEVKKV